MNADIEGTAEEIPAVNPDQMAIVPHEQQHVGTLFRTDDPVKVVEEATRVANALKQVLVNQGMLQRIGPKDHVRVEGWTTLGAMLGVVPVTVWTRKIERGWEARVEARTLDGRVIGAAEAMCSHEERRWKDSDDYAVRSMAQTRATSKALAGPLRFVITLAGFEGTPAEEMPAEGFAAPSGLGSSATGDTPTEKQLGYLRSLLRRKGGPSQDELRLIVKSLWGDRVKVEKGWTDRLNRAQVSGLIEALQDPIPTGKSDIPEPAQEEFVHPPVDEDGQEVFSPEAPH